MIINCVFSLVVVELFLMFLENVKRYLKRFVWINVDIFFGLNGYSRVVDVKFFIDIVIFFFLDVIFFLGWIIGWYFEKVNEGNNLKNIYFVG